MKKRSLIAVAAAIALAGAVGVSAASAAVTGPITFEDYSLGTVNGQHGWASTGAYDQEVVDTPDFDFGKALRISNAVTSGAFGDQTFSPAVAAAGETALTHFESSFEIATTSDLVQPGLVLSVSPDSGTGGRMSYLRFVDQADGIHVFFDDVTDAGPYYTEATFNEDDIATLDRDIPHLVEFSIDFIAGGADVVKIGLDEELVATGTTWENYYRFDNENQGAGTVPAVTALLFRAGGTAVPANEGNGFLIDNVTLTTNNIVPPTTVPPTTVPPTTVPPTTVPPTTVPPTTVPPTVIPTTVPPTTVPPTVIPTTVAPVVTPTTPPTTVASVQVNSTPTGGVGAGDGSSLPVTGSYVLPLALGGLLLILLGVGVLYARRISVIRK